MSTYNVKALVALLAVFAAFGISGCGSSDGTSNGAGTAASDCLTPEQVQQEVDNIAQGAEGSQQEVEQKQAAIQAVRDRECQ